VSGKIIVVADIKRKGFVMKNKLFLAVLVMAVVLGFGLTGCPLTDSTKFEGRWRMTMQDGSYAQFVFTGNTWAFEADNVGSTSYFSEDTSNGSFTYTDTTITFVVTASSKTDNVDKSWSLNYVLTSTTLAVSNTQGYNPTNLGNGTLKKQ
jgi:hypothetical protein